MTIKSGSLASRRSMRAYTRAFLTATLASMALSGCIAVWGSAYQVEEQSSDSITIEYDPNFASIDDVRKVAQSSCDDYGKNAVERSKSTSFWNLTTVSFRCIARHS